MKIVNETPFPVHAMPGIGPEGRPVLTIVVKGTFDIVPGEPARPAAEMAPIAFGDEMAETERGMVPLWDSDLAPFKPRGDVLLVGKAYAPGGKPCREVDLRMRVGPIDKTVRVFGERVWEGGLFGGDPRPGEPKPFTELDISYAHAFGGVDGKRGGVCLENPLGTGFIADKTKHRDVVGRKLPRVENPANLVKRWKDRPSPAAFGALGRGWSSRAAYLGTYDERWEKERAPLPPRDFSFEFYNCAPRDQQVQRYLAGDEAFEIVGATRAGRLSARLPGRGPSAGLRRTDGTDMDRAIMPLDTLVLIPGRMLMFCLWRGICTVPAVEDPGIAEIRVTTGPA